MNFFIRALLLPQIRLFSINTKHLQILQKVPFDDHRGVRPGSGSIGHPHGQVSSELLKCPKTTFELPLFRSSQGVRVRLPPLHREPEAPGGLPRRAPLLHDGQGADGVPLPADREPVGILGHLGQDTVRGGQEDLRGRVRALREHPRAVRVPGQHTDLPHRFG